MTSLKDQVFVFLKATQQFQRSVASKSRSPYFSCFHRNTVMHNSTATLFAGTLPLVSLLHSQEQLHTHLQYWCFHAVLRQPSISVQFWGFKYSSFSTTDQHCWSCTSTASAVWANHLLSKTFNDTSSATSTDALPPALVIRLHKRIILIQQS